MTDLLILHTSRAALAPDPVRKLCALAHGTGAATALEKVPLMIGQKGDDSQPALAKSIEDAAALIRSLTAARGRSVEWAKKAVRASRSYSAEEALQRGLIDLVAVDRGALLERIDDSTVKRWDGRTAHLRLRSAAVAELEQTLAERLLTVVADPQIAYLLLVLGLLGIMVELFSPGLVVPGVVGGISLLLGLYALTILPVNWAGVLLIALGLGLFGAEAFVSSYGLLALAGAASFVFGSLILVDSPLPSVRVGLELIIPSVLVLALTSLILLTRALRLRKTKAMTGPESMIGEVGEVVAAIERDQREGRVFVHGEYWAATAAAPIAGGTRVRVEQVEGRRLHVVPV